MEVVTTGLPIKKQFVSRAFFPFGALACREMGLVPASDDVAYHEATQAHTELHAVHDSFGEFIRQRILWYTQAYEALQAADTPRSMERSLEDHLMAFAISIMMDERLIR